MIVPIYTEPYNVIKENILAIQATHYPYKKNIVILLATESRATDGERHAARIIQEHKNE